MSSFYSMTGKISSPISLFFFSMTDFMNMDMNMKAISCFLIGLKFLSMRE